MAARHPGLGQEGAVVGDGDRLGGDAVGLVAPHRPGRQPRRLPRDVAFGEAVVDELDLQVHRRAPDDVGGALPRLRLGQELLVELLGVQLGVGDGDARMEPPESLDQPGGLGLVGGGADHHRALAHGLRDVLAPGDDRRVDLRPGGGEEASEGEKPGPGEEAPPHGITRALFTAAPSRIRSGPAPFRLPASSATSRIDATGSRRDAKMACRALGCARARRRGEDRRMRVLVVRTTRRWPRPRGLAPARRVAADHETDGESAARLALSEPYSLVVLDIGLPACPASRCCDGSGRRAAPCRC